MKLLVVIYGPGGYNDPEQLTAELIAALAQASQGRAAYEVSRLVLSSLPPQAGNQNANCRAIIEILSLAQRVQDGEIDEVWLWGGPDAGWYENYMAGRGSYFGNGLEDVDAPPFVLMGFNYAVGLPEALHSYVHRCEWILDHAYGGRYNGYRLDPVPPVLNDWERFTNAFRNGHGLIGAGGYSYPEGQEVFLRGWLAALPPDWWPLVLLDHVTEPLATATLDWDSLGAQNVYVSMDGGAEVLFSSGHGPAEANWIMPGHRYRFRLEQA